MCSSRCSCRNSNRNHVACAQLSALALSASVHAARHHVLHDLDEPRGAVAESGCQAGLPPSPSAHLQQVQPHLTLLRRTLPGKQDSTVQSSPFLRPPTLPVSRCHSETSHSPDMRAADRSSPGGTEDGDPSPCPPSSMASSTATPAHAEYSSPADDVGVSLEDDRPYGTVERTFKAFCGSKPGMDGKSFAKLCKDCDLVDKVLSATDVDIVFAKVVQKGQRRIGLQQFDLALELLAERRGCPHDDVCSRVRRCGGPVLNSTKADTVRFYDDKSLYTGTHAQGGPEVGRKGRGTGMTVTWSSEWPARYRKRDVDDQSSPRKDTPCSVSSLDTETHSFGHEVSPQAKDRSTSVSARKITKPLRGKDGTLEDTFQAYCSGKPDMDGKSFVKLCKDCGLLEATQITDADLIFAKVVPRGQRRIGTQQFRDALKLIAEKIGMDEELVCQRVAESDGQVHRSTKPDYVRWHDDKTTYTGTHLYGGPDAGLRTSRQAEEVWSSTLRPDNDADALPEMVWNKMVESSPLQQQPTGVRSKISEVQRKPRARLAITAKKRPPSGDNDDFTMVFTDVQGSTSLWETNPRAMEQALRLHDATIRQVLAKHSGYEVTTEGDAFQVAFHDAADAVAFCLDTQVELLRCEWPAEILLHPDAAVSSDGAWRGLRVRMGAHSGKAATVTKHEVTGRWRYAGPSVALAKAVEGVCYGGQIIISASSFSNIDGLLTQLGSPQVVDLGEHILEGNGLAEESTPGGTGRAAVQLIQLVPDALAHDYSCDASNNCGDLGAGRRFPLVESEQRVSPGFDEAPAGQSITLCFVFTKGARDLATLEPGLASEALGLLRRCLREALRGAGDGSGYECQEDEGAFMLAFASVGDAVAFSVGLQRKLPDLPWPAELKQGPRGNVYSQGLRVSIGILSGGYTSRRPHASTGRADYFGTIVNRTARIAAAAHPGQVLLGGEAPLDAVPPRFLPVQLPTSMAGFAVTPSQSQHYPGSAPPYYAQHLQSGQALAMPLIPGQIQNSFQMMHSLRPPQQAGQGWSLQRLGAFALKGIDSPIVLNELRLLDTQGNFFDSFPEPKTKGRVGP
eukprot:TRINITY_DN373_c0_g1_i11.p1 TRINITY_DN373_c0_g1~~TRINITY_DN373_c0_g1_i11.p1  ORF type:complete len:1076 (-),score=233.82 TRINITY_DN373_c0_g1_i11:43-3270(-)